MTLRQLLSAWNSFWFKPEKPTAIGLLRIMFGLTILQYCWLLAPDLYVWYGSRGVLSVETAKQIMKVPCVNAIVYLPQTNEWLLGFFVAFAAAAICVTLGLFTKPSLLLVYLGLISFHHRNTLIINSGDVLMGLTAFYLLLAPAGQAFSLDRLIHIWWSPHPRIGPPAPSSHWAQRLIQLQMAAIYCQAFWTKMIGDPWVDGTAMYWILRQREFWRFPVPFAADSLWMSKLLSWGTLVIEGALWTLIWIRDLRYWVLLGGVLLHVGIDYMMNLPMFETLMIACLIVFVDADDLTRVMDWIKQLLRSQFGPPALVAYDGGSLSGQRLAETVARLDAFGRTDLHDAQEETSSRSRLDLQKAKGGLAVHSNGQWLYGISALRWLSLRLPLMWIFLPLLYLPGSGWIGKQVTTPSS